uniref:Uncharacterized protein n=1 Tax=Anguilla anguilla TaxID=7936 RepID=A0A0E9PNV1_ANGAN
MLCTQKICSIYSFIYLFYLFLFFLKLCYL